jgi:hypothetical protein
MVLFRAIVRLIFAIAQMGGAVVLAICLYRHGAGREAMIVLFITMGVTVLSILLFRVFKVQGKDRP